MNTEELSAKVLEYARSVLAPKAKTWPAKFMIGAGSVSIARKAPSFALMAGAVSGDGTVDMPVLHEVVKSGFEAAGHLDLPGGLLGFDPQDAEDLFTWLGN